MVLKQWGNYGKFNGEFENDVKMYGTQTKTNALKTLEGFENDVKMYGTQTFFRL